MKLLGLCLPLILLAGVASSHAAEEMRTGEDLLRAMHQRYASSWYHTLTFTQKSTTYNSDGTSKVETWYEALSIPGKLRIDIGAPKDGNGFLMVDGTLAIFKDGKETGTRPFENMLLVLGFDVYRQTPEATAKIATAEGYDLKTVHEDVWEGQPVYVVGAEKGNLKSKQFWVDKNRMLFVRLFEPAREDANKIDDIRFEDYRKMSGGWVAARVEVYTEAKKVFSEEYSDIKCNVKLSPALFDPKQYPPSHGEKQ